MIARLLLLAFAWVLGSDAVRGLGINYSYPSEPVELTVSQLQAAGANAPLFIRIDEVIPQDAVCLTSKAEEDSTIELNSLYLPLVDARQAQLLESGAGASVPTFVHYDDCDLDTPKPWVQGVIESGAASFSDEMKAEFKKVGITVPDNAFVVHDQVMPDSSGGNMLQLAFALLAGLVGLTPFFNRNRFPKAAKLAGADTSEVFRAMYPALKAHGSTDERLLEELEQAALAPDTETVLLKINCEDSNQRPALAVLTNKRYILYRTKRHIPLIILSKLGQLIEKLPFGGFFSLILNPFGETYKVLVTPEKRVFREAMGYRDSELLTGQVPWKTHCSLTFAELTQHASGVLIVRQYWTNALEVSFAPRKLLRMWKKPPSFTIRQEGARIAIARLVDHFEEHLRARDVLVIRRKEDIVINWEDAVATPAS